MYVCMYVCITCTQDTYTQDTYIRTYNHTYIHTYIHTHSVTVKAASYSKLLSHYIT